MVFSNSFPIFHLDPNWPHQQPEGVLIHGQNFQIPPPPSPSPPPPVADDVGGGDKGSTRPGSMADRARLAKIEQPEEGTVKCPRCESSNTKFCYYNNYSLSQPRHFCKTCRRYWTRGGALRNVPVGGGCRRKNKRTKGTNNIKSSKSPNNKATTLATTSGSNIIIPNPNSDHHHHLISPLLFPPPPTTTCHSYSDYYDVVLGATTTTNINNNNDSAEFQIGCSNSITTTSEQWKLPSLLQHHQQFPATFLTNLESPVGFYHHQFERSENVEIEPVASRTLLYSGGGAVKMEENNMDQVVGLSSKATLTGNSSENNKNEQLWELANNINNNGSAWNNSNNNVSIGFDSSSSITHLL